MSRKKTESDANVVFRVTTLFFGGMTARDC